MSDRQRRYRERLRGGRRVYRIELDQVDAEELVASFGHADIAEVFEFFIELSKLVTRNDMDFANVLLLLAEELRTTDEGTLR